MTTAALVLMRTLHIGGAMLLVALPYFQFRARGPAGREFRDDSEGFARIVRRWLWATLMLEAISGAGWFWLVAAGMSGASPWASQTAVDLQAALVETHFGRLWLLRAAVGGIFTVVLADASRGSALRPAACLGLIGLGSLLAGSLAWAGHADAAIWDHDLHLAVDLVHLLIGSIWPMGLVPLALFLRRSRASANALSDRFEFDVLLRFSRNSLVAVLTLAVTGAVNGYLMIGSWHALVATIYGRLLIAKVAVVLLMVALGACNRVCFLPRLRSETTASLALRRAVTAECCLAGVVLVLVGVMGMTSPPS